MKGNKNRFLPITQKTIVCCPEWLLLTPEQREAVWVVSHVFPFRTNKYVIENLIDWANIPNDPMFQLTFPQKGMLEKDDYDAVHGMLVRDVSERELQEKIAQIRYSLNPHPAGQMTHNIPHMNGYDFKGVQHKYNETVLFFPAQGQTCHAFCTFCFRWPQFVDMPDLKFHTEGMKTLVRYLKVHKEVTDVLFTGGDPMIMRTVILRNYVEHLLTPGLEHIQNIRIGTKSLVYHPRRFISDEDSTDCLRLFEKVVKAGKHLTLMAHYNHPQELEPKVAKYAIQRILDTGAQIRAQSPIIRYINDDSGIWAELWREEVRLGIIPYYMFVERDTGSKIYFEVPLTRCLEIFRDAYSQVSGLARTVRGPSMSAWPGKVRIVGIATINNEKVFVLEFIQARDPAWVGRPFFAKFDAKATWFDQLKPAFGDDEFFFGKEGL